MAWPGIASHIEDIAHSVATFPIDRFFLGDGKLDLRDKKRSSLFPWRGQFSPELVDILLEAYCKQGSRLLDPFVGSGTTLLEGGRLGMEATGAEINPAALLLAKTADFMNVDQETREHAFTKAQQVLSDNSGTIHLYGEAEQGSLVSFLSESGGDPLVETILAASILIAMQHDRILSQQALAASFSRCVSILRTLPFSRLPCHVVHADARELPLPDASIDCVVTSPPYINVFNYHQNYRAAVEAIGWKPLDIAVSEIGSNRKHRANRFLTVIQYSMDMLQVLNELWRVVKPNGLALIVIGRESRVRGISFRNSELLGMLVGFSRLRLVRWHDRKFINRFGERIAEDVLVLERPLDADEHEPDIEEGREVGVWALREALVEAPDEVRDDLETAIARSTLVKPSTIFRS